MVLEVETQAGVTQSGGEITYSKKISQHQPVGWLASMGKYTYIDTD
jgi:hypothetical protein